MRRQILGGLLFAWALVGIPDIAYSDVYATKGFVYSNGTYTSIENQPNVDGVFDSGINNAGQIAGYGSLNGQGGFIYSHGTYTSLQAPQSAPNETLARGINDAGQVVGQYFDNGPHGSYNHGFLFSNGSYATMEDPNAFVNTIFGIVVAGTAAAGINNRGDVVGSYQGTGGSTHGFLYSGGVYTNIDVPSSTFTRAMAINDNGAIVGDFVDSSRQFHSFIYSNGVYTTTSLPGGMSYGINNAGDMVGGDVLLSHDGQFTELSFPENDHLRVGGTFATGLNDHGQVVGIYFSDSFPEPATWLMLLIGFAGIGLMAYRRRQNGFALDDLASFGNRSTRQFIEPQPWL